MLLPLAIFVQTLRGWIDKPLGEMFSVEDLTIKFLIFLTKQLRHYISESGLDERDSIS